MVDIAFYLATEGVARRCGLTNARYITQDGRYILSNKDLRRLRLTSQEFINGLQGIELVTREDAEGLIAANNYTLGDGTIMQVEEQEENNEQEE